MGSEINNRRIAPRWKAYDTDNSNSSVACNFDDLYGVKSEVKGQNGQK
jgi:hypothetical protein